MRKLLLFLLILPALSLAQGVSGLPDWQIYKGNPYVSPKLVISPLDTATYTAVAYKDTRSKPLADSLQPQIIRGLGSVQVKWNKTSDLPETAYVEINRDGITGYSANLYTVKRATFTTSPTALTVVSTAPYSYPPITILSVWQDLMTLLFN
ncbi:hypothetical protein GO755_30355 [Spirosoma sp. HMF4905]|uniref:Uncharacterized protein n=1 Tax=Spirosoma arboris TaxID=2682092 RepID=A0A7K1SL07_9BACT|nr:hypothetical protein [Spirosoma arboris]MVM34373.1 hypothetical protein [Spirosoma arboris]